MNIAIVVALRSELDLMLPLLGDVKQTQIDGLTFYQGAVDANQVVVMQCGIGKVNAATGVTTLINHFHPHRLINTGVAGGADKQVSVMDVVVGSQVAYHDVWCGPGCAWGQVQGLPLYYDADPDLIRCLPDGDNIKVGLICTGDQFIDSIDKVQHIKSNFPQALAVDMESAAMAQVCHLRGVGFMSLRVISDSPGASHNNAQQYVDFWADAPQHTLQVVHTLLRNLK